MQWIGCDEEYFHSGIILVNEIKGILGAIFTQLYYFKEELPRIFLHS
jgi:hypothetical protein